METVTSDHQKTLISTFIEIAVGHTMETAKQFLNATNWNLEDAINLFLIHRRNQNPEQLLPYIRDISYDSSSMNHHNSVEVCPDEIWDSTTPEQDSTLSSLYRPLGDILFNGSFEDAISASFTENLWLLVNLQSTTDFASHALNEDLWSNGAVSQAIQSNFILWQVYDDTNEEEKISSLYKIDSSPPPLVLLIDPITGQKMRSWSGQIEDQSFVEDLRKFMDSGPHEHIVSLSSKKRARTEGMTCLSNNKRIKTEKITFESTNNLADDQEDMCTFWDDNLEESDEGEALLFSQAEEESCFSSNNAAPSLGHESEETLTLPGHEEETCLEEFPVLTEEPKGDCDPSVLCSICV